MFHLHFKTQWMVSAALLAACISPIQALAEPKSPQKLAQEAIRGHFRGTDATTISSAIEQSRAKLETKSKITPNYRVAATIFFKEGVSARRLAEIAKQFEFDISATDAKVAVGNDGDAYTVLTRHPAESPAGLAGRLRASEMSALPAMRDTISENSRATRRDLVQIPLEDAVPELRYFSASVFGTLGKLATAARTAEVTTIVIDDESAESVSKQERSRKTSTLDPIRSSRVHKYVAAQAAARGTSVARATVGQAQAPLIQTMSGTPDDGPPQPAWFGSFDQDSMAAGDDPDMYKIGLWPDVDYFACTGPTCPNNWTWLPRRDRDWRVGIQRYQGRCYYVPNFYVDYDEYDDTIDPIQWYWVEVCELPHTKGAIMSQFSFSSEMKAVPGQPSEKISVSAYKQSNYEHCHPVPTGIGAETFEWPCRWDNVNAVYVLNSTFEDETHVPNPLCQEPGLRNNPFSNHSDYANCFNIYQIITNLPAPYEDTMLGDPGTLFKPTVGSGEAASFATYKIYRSYIYFAAGGLQYVTGQEAVHEYEIGTYAPGQWCIPLCAFKVKEVEVHRAFFKPVVPIGLSFSNIGGTTAKATWTNAYPEAGVNNYEWRVNGGGWNSTTASPLNMTGLSPNTSYAFEVRAVDAAANPGPSASSSFTTPGSIAITGSNGAILPSAASLYNVSNNCQSGQWHTACTWMVRKSYGDYSAVAVVVRAPDGTIPSCTNGTTQQLSSGYVRSGCSLSVLSTVYGN